MVFQAELGFDGVREFDRDAAELGVAEGVDVVFAAGDEVAAGITQAFGGDDDAVAVSLYAVLDFSKKCCLVEGDFGEEDDVRRFVAIAGEAGGGGDPASVATHGLEDEDFGRGVVHGFDVQRGFEGRDGDVFSGAAEAWGVVGEG